MANGADGPKEVLFEFSKVGNQLRVAAIDPVSGVEIVVVAPMSATRRHIEQIAIAKLKRRIAQLSGE